MRDICQRELGAWCERVWVDATENLVGFVPGRTSDDRKAVHVMAHMDELSMIVKRIESDGAMHVMAMGGMWPYNFGQGAVEVLGDARTLPGVLSAGSMHTTEESPVQWRSKEKGDNKALRWMDLRVVTRLSPDDLAAAGVHAGTRVVLARHRRELWPIGDCIGGYFMDNRAAIVTALAMLARLREAGQQPAHDLYVVMSAREELGGCGAAFAARDLPGDTSIALDVGPAAAEYGLELNDQPIIVYGDAATVYHKPLSDHMFASARALKLRPQTAVFSSYRSDASIASEYGQTARAALLAIPTENTHGYEIIARRGMDNAARTLAHTLMTLP